ncbi:MAG: hypothetical protein KGI38_08955 [Thaumarchaeota archaeon]|nr:hypothetical protein [Nitrososphaerota archaeon]
MPLSGEGYEKLSSLKRLSKAAYFATSILDDAVTLDNYSPELHSGEFYQLPYRRNMELEWFNDPSYVMDLVFGEIGRGIALSERNILFQELEHLAARRPTRQPFVHLLAVITEMIQEGYQPSLILAPVDYFTEWHTRWLNPPAQGQMRLSLEDDKSYLNLGNVAKVRVVWSNKLAPSTDFFVLDKAWAKWISKPNKHNRFEIKISELPAGFDIIFRTVYRLEVLDAQMVRRVSPLASEETRPTRASVRTEHNHP